MTLASELNKGTEKEMKIPAISTIWRGSFFITSLLRNKSGFLRDLGGYIL